MSRDVETPRFKITQHYSDSDYMLLDTDCIIGQVPNLEDAIRLVRRANMHDEFVKRLEEVKENLWLRADHSDEDCPVVNIGSGVWIRLNETLEKVKGE